MRREKMRKKKCRGDENEKRNIRRRKKEHTHRKKCRDGRSRGQRRHEEK